jgi:glycosyltransferase involved in cell wall biosynthesis
VYFAASRFYAERAVRFGVSPDRLRLVYHGVETFEPPAGAREAFRKRLGIEDGQPLLVCPGRVYTRKNQHDLMRALPAVLDRVPQARLLLAGRVSDFAYAREMWRLAQDSGVSDAVTLLEDLTAADMPSVYAAADAVVAPSLEEGLGLAVIESMAAGLAVVATDVVGFNEVVTGGHDGLLVPLGDVQALARAVADVLESADLRAELGGRARATVRTRFSQDAMVSATLDGYADALAAQAGRG